MIGTSKIRVITCLDEKIKGLFSILSNIYDGVLCKNTQLANTCLKLTTETLVGVKYVQGL